LLVQGSGIQGFVPISHLVDVNGPLLEPERQKKLSGYIGRTLRLKVIECEPTQDRIVLSERAALAGEGRRKQLFKTLKPGDHVEGAVTNIIDFGVFLDLGGLEGLIHVSELSWGRVQHPSDLVEIGQHIKAMVLSVSEENGRVALSIKRLQSNPWDRVVKAYQPGDVVPAVITSVMKFGAFARLHEGVEGLIHVSTIDLPAGSAVCDVLKVGMEVQVRILHIDPSRRRLGLGLVRA
jgi:small subunit ribosomal protein S1